MFIYYIFFAEKSALVILSYGLLILSIHRAIEGLYTFRVSVWGWVISILFALLLSLYLYLSV